MKVLLAGYNIDTETLRKFKIRMTPETISAAYARISRSSQSVDELRRIARKEVEKARQSNKRIIFEMGHHSIAEHSVFNFDLIDISRLAIEEVEKFRLNSYTEKSQRYVALTTDNFIVPRELETDPELYDDFVNTVKIQMYFYSQLIEKLKKTRLQAPDTGNRFIEDARYILPLTTTGQLGMTINGRNLELMIRRFASQELLELRALGEKLYTLSSEIAPSIILFYKATDYDAKTYSLIYSQAQPNFRTQELKNPRTLELKDFVRLVHHTQDADNILIAALLFRVTNLPYNKCLRKATKMMLYQKKELIKTAFEHCQFYDTVLREFEHIYLTFDLVVSAACFGQLKRHRMTTITQQAYDPELGITIPKSIGESEEVKRFQEIINRTEATYYKIKEKYPLIAPYILTNSHRRRVLLTVNARELYHISRLREDKSAQWDIRNLTKKMVEAAKHFMPLTLHFIGGKDRYPEIHKEIFEK